MLIRKRLNPYGIYDCVVFLDVCWYFVMLNFLKHNSKFPRCIYLLLWKQILFLRS